MKEEHEKLRAKYLTEYIYEKHNQDKCLGFIDGFEKAIQALSQREWVSVEDRLPELVGNKYLIYCGKEYKIAEYLGGNFWDDDFGNIKDSQVTHWTPIFKAPQTK